MPEKNKVNQRILSTLSYSMCFVMAFIVFACMPPAADEKKETIRFDYSWKDGTVRKIYEYELAQNMDSLIHFMKHKNPAYRYAASKAMASVRSEDGLSALIPLLSDSVPQVAEAAAFAVGQIGAVGSVTHLMNAFRAQDSVGNYKRFNQAVLEAAGKCGEERTLELLASISTYGPRDTFLLMGQVAGIYRLMSRNFVSPAGTAVMAKFVSNDNFPRSVRVLAANYFYRVREIDMSDFTYTFKRVLENDKNPHIRMAMATVLARHAAPAALPGFFEVVIQDADYRVKTNFIRALGSRRIPELALEIRANIKKYPYPLQRVAAEYLLNNGHEEGSIGYWDLAQVPELHYEAAHTLAAAASRHLPFYYSITRQQVARFLKGRYAGTENIYEKRSALRAMAYDADNRGFLVQEAGNVENPLLKSGVAEALILMYDDQHRDGRSNAQKRRAKQGLIPAMITLMQSGDVGAAALIAGFLRSDWEDVAPYIRDSAPIEALLPTFKLPAEIETYNEVAHLVATIKGSGFEPKKADKVKSMNWTMFDSWDDNPVASIKTNRGSVNIELLKETAPLTVANFVQLANDGFFNGKSIHRVVPNFVIQTGCPRGDGYGSLDFTISSELTGPSYNKEGYVGMASAGNHTECSQWFITHSPAFHLDGNYTVFGKVTRGMNIVHDTEVGDQIQTVSVN